MCVTCLGRKFDEDFEALWSFESLNKTKSLNKPWIPEQASKVSTSHQKLANFFFKVWHVT